MKKVERYYKVLNEDGSCFHGGSGKWPLPIGKKKGAWMPKIEALKMCLSGYHILKREQLVEWLGPAIFEVEVRGKVIWADDKGIAQEARLICKLQTWNVCTARLFACDCADTVRHLMRDKRSTDAIDVSRRFANGNATGDELAAAWVAARTAAGAAARDAAGTAAWAAARAAARDAAWVVAGTAARAAAWAAARDAAQAAARAAEWYAARDAEWYAARDAAWYAARDAARDAQNKRLWEYLEVK